MSGKYQPADYWNRTVSGTLDLSAVGHPTLGAYNRIAYRLRLNAFESAVNRLTAWPKVRVFEAGFGVGFYLQYVVSAGVTELTGVDLSNSAVTRGQHVFPHFCLMQRDVSDSLPESIGEFDLVTAIDVLYHIVDDERWESAVHHLCSLVAPAGTLLFTDKFPRGGVYQRFPHVKRRSLELYANLLRRHQLRIERIRPVFVFMDDPITCGEHSWLGRVSYVQWRLIRKLIRVLEPYPAVRDALALVLGGMQYPFERAAVTMLKRSPNLEMVTVVRDE